MTAVLSVVAEKDPRTGKPETVAQRVARLQAEARKLAKDHVLEMTVAMNQLAALAAEIAEGGEAYPVGVRDIARRVAEDIDLRLQTVELLARRAA